MKFKRTFACQTVGGRTYQCLKDSRLCRPPAFSLVVETQRLLVDCEVHLTGLAWLEEDLLEGFQLLDRTIDRGLLVADVKLNGLGTSLAAGIRHADGEGHLTVGSHRRLISCKLTQLESGVAQAMSESEERITFHFSLFTFHFIYPAITHVDALLVLLVDNLMILAPGAGIGVKGMGTTLLQTGIPREGELA